MSEPEAQTNESQLVSYYQRRGLVPTRRDHRSAAAVQLPNGWHPSWFLRPLPLCQLRPTMPNKGWF
jgi:hypothetical protein